MDRCFTTALAEKIGLSKDRFPSTAEETALAEEALFQELDKLSLEEQEKITFDVHGIETTTATASVGPENDDQVPSSSAASSLEEKEAEYLNLLHEEIRKTPMDKSAYQQALYLNAEYVQNPKFLLMFLRGQRYNIKAAAEQIIFHFQHKRDFFASDDILVRDVRFSDLTPQDITCLQSGAFQVLPNRDGAGRAVVFFAPGYRPIVPIDCMIRAYWCFFWTLLLDEETQKHGMVNIVYTIGRCGRSQDQENSAKLMAQFQGLHQALPIKAAATHLCGNHTSGNQNINAIRQQHQQQAADEKTSSTTTAADNNSNDDMNDIKSRSYLTGMKLFMPEEERNRTRSHYHNDPNDLNFFLSTYSIPTHDIPIDPNQRDVLLLDFHTDWVQAQRKREETQVEALANNNKQHIGRKVAQNVIILPRRFDVLFGRGKHTRLHTGNLRVAHLVEMHLESYQNAGKFAKTEIAERIVTIIYESHGRFLKWHNGHWVEVLDSQVIREKISHMFRNLRSNSKHSSDPKASKTTTNTGGPSIANTATENCKRHHSMGIAKRRAVTPPIIATTQDDKSNQ